MSRYVACLSLATLLFAASAARAASVSTPEEATDLARSEGYGLVSKAEKASDIWEVWASKNGIPYELRIDAESGSVLLAAPAQDDD